MILQVIQKPPHETSTCLHLRAIHIDTILQSLSALVLFFDGANSDDKDKMLGVKSRCIYIYINMYINSKTINIYISIDE